jgi:hypothetical protein
MVEFTPSTILLYSSPPIPGIVSTGLIFPFAYVIFPPYSPSYTLSLYPPPLPLVPTPRKDLFYLPVLRF